MSVAQSTAKGRNVARGKAAPSTERIVNDDPRLLDVEIGDVSYQGDIILICISSLPKSAKPSDVRQLAEGDTPGSRHILERGKVFRADATEIRELIAKAMEKRGLKDPASRMRNTEPEYIGPVFVSDAPATENDLTHPEHGNQGFNHPEGTCMAVIFQRTVDSEGRIRRTRD